MKGFCLLINCLLLQCDDDQITRRITIIIMRVQVWRLYMATVSKIIISYIFIILLCLNTAIADDKRNMELILDASGSMNAKLRSGERRIDAAKTAVNQLVDTLPGDINMSFRAYGHQFYQSQKNCQDTALLVPFGLLSSVKKSIVSSAQTLKAQGYTPISEVLGLAADDLKDLQGPKSIVLVSDGKETCEGDPCLLAKKLIAADADLVIHAIGFDVYQQARGQLQCIARVGKGMYLDAGSAEQLANSINDVITTEIEEEVIVINKAQPSTGYLIIKSPYFNEVVNADTGQLVTKITENNNNVELKTGIYNIQFGENMWLKSVEVIGGETTLINPGRLKVIRPYFNAVLDPETDEQIEKATESHNDFPLLAGRYNVQFGKAVWRNVEIFEGKTTLLEPGRLRMQQPYFNKVLDHQTTEEIEKLTESRNDIALPPGTYDVVFGKAIWQGIEIKQGETTLLKPARLKMEKPYFNEIIDSTTQQEVEKLTESHNDIPLPPGKYAVDFGNGLLQHIELLPGQTKRLNPGRIKIEKEGSFYYTLFDETGRMVIKLTSDTNDIPLPAGDFLLDIDGREVSVTLEAGKRKIIKVK